MASFESSPGQLTILVFRPFPNPAARQWLAAYGLMDADDIPILNHPLQFICQNVKDYSEYRSPACETMEANVIRDLGQRSKPTSMLMTKHRDDRFPSFAKLDNSGHIVNIAY